MTRTEREETRIAMGEPLCECLPDQREWYGITPVLIPTNAEAADENLKMRNYRAARPYAGLVLCFRCKRVADRDNEPVGQCGLRSVVDLWLPTRRTSSAHQN